jgi:hypothetical protein
VPGLQLGRRVGPEKQGEANAGLPRVERTQRVHGIGRTGPLQLGPLDREAARASYRELEHRGPVLRGCAVQALFERLLPGGHETQAVEPQHLGRHLAHDEMPVMHGIEGAAEQTDQVPAGCAGQRELRRTALGWKRRR